MGTRSPMQSPPSKRRPSWLANQLTSRMQLRLSQLLKQRRNRSKQTWQRPGSSTANLQFYIFVQSFSFLARSLCRLTWHLHFIFRGGLVFCVTTRLPGHVNRVYQNADMHSI